jgi:hypothetical protein
MISTSTYVLPIINFASGILSMAAVLSSLAETGLRLRTRRANQ